MRFLVHAEQRPDLTEAERHAFYGAMQVFYEQVPPDVRLEADFIKADRTGSYSVLTVPDRAVVDRILAPFEGWVVLEVVELA